MTNEKRKAAIIKLDKRIIHCTKRIEESDLRIKLLKKRKVDALKLIEECKANIVIHKKFLNSKK